MNGMANMEGTVCSVPSPFPCGVSATQPWKVRNTLHTAGKETPLHQRDSVRQMLDILSNHHEIPHGRHRGSETLSSVQWSLNQHEETNLMLHRLAHGDEHDLRSSIRDQD